MGRKKVHTSNPTRLDSDKTLINLRKWMKPLWSDKTLQLRNFKDTGRGVSSKYFTEKDSTLIEIPYELMITLSILEKSDLRDYIDREEKLKWHDLLAAFLVLERHKAEGSAWKEYLNTLPENIPLLPWFCTGEELMRIPGELRNEIKKRQVDFEASWVRLKKSMFSAGVCCGCCGKNLSRVFTLNSFAWGYVMVNTRAVYVDPDTVKTLSDGSMKDVLSDDPNMALCPFLDMFNHSPNASTKAEIHGDKYKLTTCTSYRRYEEIFISYGAHDNVKLLCEYGFFTPTNKFDNIQIKLSDIINVLNVNQRQYKFLQEKNFNDANVSLSGLSFHLKCLLFITLRPEINNWTSYIYSETYTGTDLIDFYNLTKKILTNKKIENTTREHSSEYFKHLMDYLNYTNTYLESVIQFLTGEINQIATTCHLNE